MPTETRKATPAGEPEQLILETEAADDIYRYVVELREHPDGDEEGEAVVIERSRHDESGREDLEPKTTDAIRDHLAEQGYRVESAA